MSKFWIFSEWHSQKQSRFSRLITLTFCKKGCEMTTRLMMPAWCISWWQTQQLQTLGVRVWSAVYQLHASSNRSHSNSSSSCMLHRSSIKICLQRWWAVFQSRAPQSTVRLVSTSTAPPKQTMGLQKLSKMASINNPQWSHQCPHLKHRVKLWISNSRVWT